MAKYETLVNAIPDCDIHGGAHPAEFDGKTVMGPWANMCAEAMNSVGIGLGTGKGQRLVLRAPVAPVAEPVSLAKGPRYPRPTVDRPDMDTLEEWAMDSVVEATDGCEVEPDGTCYHGHPSWLIRLGMI